MLDLGCGPGPLARAFAPLCAEVVAIDPEPAMLAEAEAAPAANIVWQRGSSYDIGPALGTFHLCTMGRSFHWMDRADTLRRLDSMIGPGGAVALFHDSHPDLPDNAWQAGWKSLLDRYGDRTLRATASPGSGTRRSCWIPPLPSLRKSASSSAAAPPSPRWWTAALSLSANSPPSSVTRRSHSCAS